MSLHIHKYTHKFKDGTTITLTADLSKDKPEFKLSLEMQTRPDLRSEYEEWRWIVCEDLFKLMNVKQLAVCGIIAENMLKEEKDANNN